jgi:hypothetical protein
VVADVVKKQPGRYPIFRAGDIAEDFMPILGIAYRRIEVSALPFAPALAPVFGVAVFGVVVFGVAVLGAVRDPAVPVAVPLLFAPAVPVVWAAFPLPA